MATSYDTESAANKALIDDWAGNLRAQLGELYRINNRIQAIRSQYNEEISPLLSSWTALEAVPNNSGLAGSSPSETHEQMETWQQFLNDWDTSMYSVAKSAQWVSAAGVANTTGAE